MPLEAQTLKSGIQTQLQPLIESKTKKAFADAMLKFKEVSEEQAGKNEESPNLFSRANQEASEVFSGVMKELAESIASVVSTNVDIFVKSGTVNVLVTGVTVGPPSPHAITAQPGIGSMT